MLKRSSLFSLALLTLAWNEAQACTNNWTTGASGNYGWNAQGNWELGTCIPGITGGGGVGDVANFTEATPSPQTVYLTNEASPPVSCIVTIGQIVFANAGTYTLADDIAVTGGQINFDSLSPNAVLSVNDGGTLNYQATTYVVQALNIDNYDGTFLFNGGCSVQTAPGSTTSTINVNSSGTDPITLSCIEGLIGFGDKKTTLTFNNGTITNTEIVGNCASITISSPSSVVFDNQGGTGGSALGPLFGAIVIGSNATVNNTVDSNFGQFGTSIAIESNAIVNNSSTVTAAPPSYGFGTNNGTITWSSTGTLTNSSFFGYGVSTAINFSNGTVANTGSFGQTAKAINYSGGTFNNNGGSFGLDADNITFSNSATYTSSTHTSSFGGTNSVVILNGSSEVTGSSAFDNQNINASSFTLNNSSTLFTSGIAVVNATTVNGTAIFTLDNEGASSGTGGSSGTVSVTGGLLNIYNDGVNPSAADTYGQVYRVTGAGGIAVSGGTLYVFNDNMSTSGTGSVGAWLDNSGSLSMTGGNVVVRHGAVASITSATGALMNVGTSVSMTGSALTTLQLIANASGGTYTGTGVAFEVGDNVTMSNPNATFSATNSMDAVVGFQGIYGQVDGNFSISAGSFELSNSGTVSAGAATAGVNFLVEGTFALSGTGAVSNTSTDGGTGIGSQFTSSGLFTMSGGATPVALTNSGIDAIFNANGGFTQTGGTTYNTLQAEFNGTTITLNGGTFDNSGYVSVTNLSIGGGTVNSNNINTPNPPFTCFTPYPFMIASGDFTMTSGTLTFNNSSACGAITANEKTGSLIQGTTLVNITGGAINATNTAAINAPPGNGSVGCELSGGSPSVSNPFTIGGTAVVTMINTGAISANTENIGAYLYNTSNTNPMVFSGTAIVGMTNAGSVSEQAVGVKIISGNSPSSIAPLTVNGATINMVNTYNLAPTTLGASGAYIQGSVVTINSGSMNLANNNTGTAPNQGILTPIAPGMTGVGTVGSIGDFTSLALNGGSLNLTNNGMLMPIVVPGPGAVVGAGVVVATTFTQTATGAFTATNNAAIEAGIGAELYIGAATSLSGTGSWMAINNGEATAGLGVQITSNGAFTLSGPTVTLNNDAILGATAPGTAIGVALIANNVLNISSGTLNVENTDAVLGLVPAGAAVSVMNLATSATATSMTGGALNVSNMGGVSGAAVIGAQYAAATNDFVQSGGAVAVTNSGTISSTSALGPNMGTAGAALTALGGTGNITLTNLTMTNSGRVSTTGVGTGAAVIALGGLNLGSATGSVTNTAGTLINGTGTSIGVLCQGGALELTMPGSVTYSNLGTVQNSAANIGVSLLASTGNITMSGSGTFTLTNSGTVTTGTGMQLGATAGSLTLNSGAIALTNSGSTINGPAGIGTQLYLPGGGGNLTIQNSAIGLNLLNSDALSVGTAALATVGGSFSISTGALTLNNTGAVTGTATGVGMTVAGTTTQTGGTVTVSNTNGTSTTSSYFQSTGPIGISGGTFTNNSLVGADTINLTGGTLQSANGVFTGSNLTPGTGIATVTNSGGTFIPGSDPLPSLTTFDLGTYTQTAGVFELVIGNLSLPSDTGQANSFLHVINTGGTEVTLSGGTLVVVPSSAGVNIPAGDNMVQFIQTSTTTATPSTISGGFATSFPAADIINTVPGMNSWFYETLTDINGNQQGWLFFNYTPPPIPPTPPTPPPAPPPHTPIPNPPITITTVNTINTFLWGLMLDMQLGYGAGGAGGGAESDEECDRWYPSRKRCHKKRKPIASDSSSVKMESMKGGSQTIAGPMIASATPQLGFVNFQRMVKEQQLSSEAAGGRVIRPWDVYFGPIGDFGKINNKHSQVGAHYYYVGGLAGFDYAFPQVGTGVLVDYEHVNAKLNKHAGRFWVNQFHVNSYTTYVPRSLPEIAFNAIVAAGGAWYDIHRTVVESPKESTHAKTRGAQVDALLGTQYVFGHRQFESIPPKLMIIPMFNMQYIYQGIGRYKEHGAGTFNQMFSKQGFQSLRSTLGTWIEYTWGSSNFTFTPLFNLSWQREYLDRNHKVFATPIEVEGPTSSITIFGAGRDTLLTGIDMLFEFYEIYGLEFSYEFEFNNLYHNNAFYLGFDVNF